MSKRGHSDCFPAVGLAFYEVPKRLALRVSAPRKDMPDESKARWPWGGGSYNCSFFVAIEASIVGSTGWRRRGGH